MHAGPLVGHHLLGTVAHTVGDDPVGIREDSRPAAAQVTVEMKVERERVSVTISNPHDQHRAERGEAAQMLRDALGTAAVEEASLLFFDGGVGDYHKCEEAIAELYELLSVKQSAQSEGHTGDEETTNAFGDMAVTRWCSRRRKSSGAATVLEESSKTRRVRLPFGQRCSCSKIWASPLKQPHGLRTSTAAARRSGHCTEADRQWLQNMRLRSVKHEREPGESVATGTLW